ncbi:hypothetical protein [Bdellovibrio reynosensis]|uniref:DUF2007 domain-containing protein n=1 Tax=Bdellovibrio reynosensis TaxID=2835041 RepID=A0ABY4CCZ8_9BACT|nr:hypothetical protein [Bdellovibrio reynosensis]UOF01408.1 hypothetical protein MNR06_00380 [Bdellovibrio reynosensis]
MNSNEYVFLMDCADFAEAQVIKSFLLSHGLHPRVRDEQTRGVAPHLGQVLGKLTLEIPEHEYMDASLALESKERPSLKLVSTTPLEETQAIAKRSLLNAVLGCVLVPILCNLMSMSMGYRVLKQEVPLSKYSRNKLLLAIVFNSVAFFFWLTIGPKFIFK